MLQMLSFRGAWNASVPSTSLPKLHWDATIGGFDHDWLAIGRGECSKQNYLSYLDQLYGLIQHTASL